MPSFLSMACFLNVKAAIKVSSDAITRTIRSVMFIFVSCIGRTVAEIPRTSRMLNIFDPITLPRASCELPLSAAMMHVISSGRDVPTATRVIDITDSLNPRCFATVIAELRNISPPNMSAANDAAAMVINNHTGFPSNDDFAVSSASGPVSFE